jgi:ankyrin repeat protein
MKGIFRMKRMILAPSLFMVFFVSAQSQEIFDLLRKGDVPAVKALIEKAPGLVEARDSDGGTPLHYAVLGGNVELITYLIDKGAKLDLQDAEMKTSLHLAAINDRKEAVAVLLKRGAVLETRDDYGRTALILCARERGQAGTGRVLIEAGADVNAADKFGSTALELAAWRGKAEFIDLLLEKGARLPESGRSWGGMLSQSAEKGLTNLFRRLTEGGQDLKTVDPSGVWLLHSAAAGGSAEIVGLLLDKGFGPGKSDRFGWTPLHYAARDGRTDAARILIEKGAPLDSRTVMGQTAFNVAQERKMESTAGLLAEKGADKSGLRFPVLEGDYLGQKPPGDKPELFGLGIISSIWGLHSTAVFSPDGNEVYWAPMMRFPAEIYSRGGLLMMKRVNGRWTPPEWALFSGPEGNDDVPFFSQDGKKIYFISRRPLPGEKERGSERIWFADRTPSGWSEPQPLDPNVNSVDKHWEFSLDRERNVYFGGQAADSLGRQDIYLARFVEGKYEKPVNLGVPINSAAGENTPFIAPDGSYLLFEREYDLWVSFRGTDGAWSEPVKLGPDVNSPSVELCPIVTADGKYLFFLSQRDGESHAYWVRADVIGKEKARSGNDDRKAGDQEAERQTVAQVISSVIGWAKDKDLELFYGSIANDEDYISVTPGKKVIKRFEDVKQNIPFWMSPDFKYVRHELKDLEIKFARCGEVAWFYCVLDDINTYKGEPASWENTRWTGVVEKRDGKWVVVSQHFSFASDS